MQRTWIKICGITRAEDARLATELGVDALGFVLTESPRRVSASAAREIASEIPAHVLKFGVFVNEGADEILRALDEIGLDRAQLHGTTDPTTLTRVGARGVPAFRARDASVVGDIEESGAPLFFLDTWSPRAVGGTGETFDWEIARRARSLGRLILAGGLQSSNVSDAMEAVHPFGVDVSSGTESSPGTKDPHKLRAFVSAVREADRQFVEETRDA